MKEYLRIFAVLVSFFIMFFPACANAADEESNCSNAGNSPKRLNRLTVYFENDLFIGTDSDYTNGVKLSWVSAKLDDYSDKNIPKCARALNSLYSGIKKILHSDLEGASRNMVVSLGQAMYTPQNSLIKNLIVNDRPYAGWLYLGVGYFDRTEDVMDSLDINLGVVGPAALAKQAQDIIHDWRTLPRFNGWDNQLKNEPGIQVVKERKWKVTDRKYMDFIPHAGMSLGNVKTYLNSGFEFRIGRIPDDFGTSSIRPGSDSNPPARSNDVMAHFFVSADGRMVFRDIFLDGNTFAHSHSVTKKTFTGDIAGGVAIQIHDAKITISRNRTSREFTTQTAAHGFGAITASLCFDW